MKLVHKCLICALLVVPHLSSRCPQWVSWHRASQHLPSWSSACLHSCCSFYTLYKHCCLKLLQSRWILSPYLPNNSSLLVMFSLPADSVPPLLTVTLTNDQKTTWPVCECITGIVCEHFSLLNYTLSQEQDQYEWWSLKRHAFSKC